MKLVTYNIQYGVGKDGKSDLRRIAEAVEGADVIALQEVVRHMPMTNTGDQPAELAALLPGYRWVYGPAIDLDASEQAADGTVVNRRMQFGNMLLTRRPILSSRLHMLPKLAPINVQTSQRAALEGVIEPDSGPLRLYSIHLSAAYTRERRQQVEHLLRLYRDGPLTGAMCDGPNNWAERNGLTAPPLPEATVIMGDFNFEPSHPEYALMTGEVDPVYGRIATRDGFVDALGGGRPWRGRGRHLPALSGEQHAARHASRLRVCQRRPGGPDPRRPDRQPGRGLGPSARGGGDRSLRPGPGAIPLK